MSKGFLCASCYCTSSYLNQRHAPVPSVFHNACPNVLFTWQDVISSLISSAVTHLTLKNGLCIASYLPLPTVLASRLPAGELEVADSVGGCVCLYLCKCVDRGVLDGAFAQYLLRHARFCVFAWKSVNVCDRCQLLCQGWGYTFSPQPRCLQRFVSTQQLGENLLPLHTHLYQQAHSHPAP